MPESRFFIGHVEVVCLTDIDVELPVPLSQLFPGVPLEAWAPWRERYPEIFPGPDSWRAHFGSFLLRSQGRTILVDTGIGTHATNPGSVALFTRGQDGRLLAELEAAGVRPEEVQTVFFTHLHPDHVGWNLSQRGPHPQATFPRARYIAHLADWDAFRKPEVQQVFPPFWEETLAPLEQLGVVDLITGERTLTEEITAIPTPGHTPGSMSLAIVSAGQRALIVGDVMHAPPQVTEPEWVFGFDMDPALAVRTRRQMVDRAEAEHAALIMCHHAGVGRVVRFQERRYWQGWSGEEHRR